MHNSCELLNYIYKITIIMILRIDNINKKINNKKINKILGNYKKKYLSIIDDIKKELKRCNGIKENIGIVDKILSSYFVFLSEDKLIKKYIIMSNNSIKDINIKMNIYDYNKDTLLLCNKLILTIIDNINILSKYV